MRNCCQSRQEVLYPFDETEHEHDELEKLLKFVAGSGGHGGFYKCKDCGQMWREDVNSKMGDATFTKVRDAQVESKFPGLQRAGCCESRPISIAERGPFEPVTAHDDKQRQELAPILEWLCRGEHNGDPVLCRCSQCGQFWLRNYAILYEGDASYRKLSSAEEARRKFPNAEFEEERE